MVLSFTGLTLNAHLSTSYSVLYLTNDECHLLSIHSFYAPMYFILSWRCLSSMYQKQGSSLAFFILQLLYSVVNAIRSFSMISLYVLHRSIHALCASPWELAVSATWHTKKHGPYMSSPDNDIQGHSWEQWLCPHPLYWFYPTSSS